MLDNDVGIRVIDSSSKDVPSVESMVCNCIPHGVRMGILQIGKQGPVLVIFENNDERLKYKTQRHHTLL